MKVSELFGRAELEYPPELGDIEIKDIVTDSRKVSQGCLFICIKGLHSDSHDYVDDAIKAGARVIVAERVREMCVGGAAAYIVLKNTRKASALLYNAWYGNVSKKMKIIGVTGTNGKTSVCFMLSHVFESFGYRCGIIGTVCCRSAEGKTLSLSNSNELANMTTPDPSELYAMLAQMYEDGVEYVFMEVTSHALALCKVDAIEFDMAVFTNLTQDHLDFHGDMSKYFQAKQKLFSMCRRAVINRDDRAGREIIKNIGTECVGYSVNDGDYVARNIVSQGASGSSYILITPTESFSVDLNIAGIFSVYNSLAAASVALEYGIPPAAVQRALNSAIGVVGRMESVSVCGADVSVIIDYAHTPDALENLLRTVRAFKDKTSRIRLVFGCGGERDRGKRREMGIIASRLSDHVTVTSDNSRGEDPERIISDILKGIDKEKNHAVIIDRREAIEETIMLAKSGDVIVLAGKGHEKYEINSKGRAPFDEREIARNALLRRINSDGAAGRC